MAEKESPRLVIVDEPRNRREWRADRFRELGYPNDIAEFLASGKVDHWKAKELLDDGCSLALVLRILL